MQGFEDFFTSLPGRLIAWLGGPVLVLFAVFIAFMSQPWTGIGIVGWGGVVLFSLFVAGAMMWPKSFPWAGKAICGVLVALWIGHVVAVIASHQRSEVWWTPLLTFVFIGGPALVYLTGQMRFRVHWSPPARTHIEFTSKVPEPESQSGAVTEEEEELLPFGRPTLAVLRDALECRGLEVRRYSDDFYREHEADGILRHSSYAWTMDVRPKGGRYVSLLIQGDGDERLLIADDHRGLIRWLTRQPRVDLNALLAAVEEILHGDARFAQIQTYTPDEFENQPGSRRPGARSAR
jgi:hypothetical protein